MTTSRTFLMAGGGTGGHVIPALAVARELESRGHHPVFVGTHEGFEAKLVPGAGFPIEWITIGGLKGVGTLKMLRTLLGLPGGVVRAFGILRCHRPAAVFSMGGYVAGPVMIAAALRGVPIVALEPNAIPGFTNRRMARFIRCTLVSFPETSRFFPEGRTKVIGVPVRRAFFELPPKAHETRLTILITGGSRGSRTLNNAAQQSWPLFLDAGLDVRIIHQTGAVAPHEEIAHDFARTGLDGRVVPFIHDMPATFAEADLIVCRSGAGALAELAAAGKPAILVPFPFATDDHQLHNAEAFQSAGAARLVLDSEMTGARLVREVRELASARPLLDQMAANARALARPEAAERAADLLEKVSQPAA
ncbi:MAG: undecaprenyldiphospho-muramoylpentapeptide beta-N-acetylglucosaminyltransferase [Bryobacteraceae bacterium]|jgi:UDP-N-acetylglucosamine--N-acetylmuramyl-(pentapeptide) pyrophosphoryl-undecaprenol N-acetylglucosamine transferase